MATDREIKFGRVLAIANVLGEKVLDKGQMGISQKHMQRYGYKPVDTLYRIHKDIMEHAHKFGEEEMILFDLLMEEMAQFDWDEFTDTPLRGRYLQAYSAQKNVLDNVMGVVEAAEKWEYDSSGTVKNMCATGKVEAKKVGRDWVIAKNHPNPKFIKRYSFYSDFSIEGHIKVFWEKGTFAITAEGLPFISGFLGGSVEECMITFVKDSLALKLTLDGFGGLILNHKDSDPKVVQYLKDFYASSPSGTTYLTMPNKFLNSDFESYFAKGKG